MDLEWQNLHQKDQKESLGQQKMWQLTLTCEDKKQEEDSTDLTKNGESCAQRLDDICRS